MPYEEKVRILKSDGFEEVEVVNVSEVKAESEWSKVVDFISKMWCENTGKQWLAESAVELMGKQKKLHVFLKAGM